MLHPSPGPLPLQSLTRGGGEEDAGVVRVPAHRIHRHVVAVVGGQVLPAVVDTALVDAALLRAHQEDALLEGGEREAAPARQPRQAALLFCGHARHRCHRGRRHATRTRTRGARPARRAASPGGAGERHEARDAGLCHAPRTRWVQYGLLGGVRGGGELERHEHLHLQL